MRQAALLLTVILGALALAACSLSGSDPTPTPTPEPTAEPGSKCFEFTGTFTGTLKTDCGVDITIVSETEEPPPPTPTPTATPTPTVKPASTQVPEVEIPTPTAAPEPSPTLSVEPTAEPTPTSRAVRRASPEPTSTALPGLDVSVVDGALVISWPVVPGSAAYGVHVHQFSPFSGELAQGRKSFQLWADSPREATVDLLDDAETWTVKVVGIDGNLHELGRFESRGRVETEKGSGE